MQPGRRVGRFVVERLLGAGGMGAVYAARDEVLDRSVALKVLPAAHEDDPDRRTRLLREARSAASLSHPNVAIVYEAGEDEGVVFLAMELVDGESLASRVARGPLSLDEVVSIGAGIANGLAAAHAVGVVHRDLKPANVMLARRGVPKLVDFGLARAPDRAQAPSRESRESVPGTIVGTPGYMAPEQLRAEATDARTDLFALGVVLHELWTGRAPFGDGGLRAMALTLYEEAAPLDRERPGAPPALTALVQHLLQKEAGSRPGSATEVADRLATLLRPAPASPTTSSDTTTPRSTAAAALSGEPTMAQRGPPAPLGSGPTMALREVALESQSTLLGRDADVAAVERTLLAEGRIVTVTGAPGIGKSTLVGHVASRARDRGVRVTSVQVGPTATIEELEGALAVALRRGAGTTWLEQLALEDGLIVIDGGEASGEELGRRLPAWSSRAPSARWLLARRNELSVPEEDVVCLGPLPRVAARELFSARARRAKGTSVVVDADELAAIDAIIDVVGASPLALCLAASRTNLLSPREIATRLTAGTDDERLALLHDRKAPRAAASLRDAISWSFAILDPLHARVLARLSVFESPFDVESATQVVCVAGEPIDPMSVLETIEAARGASLVRSLADASSRARVALEPNVRAYARGRLRDDAAASAVETAFVELMARRARAAVTSPASSPERTAHLLADDAGSLRAAHRLGRGREELASEAAWIATALLGRGPDPSIEQSLEEFLADPRRPSLELAVHAGVVILHRLGERDVVAAASRASSLVAQASEGRDPGLLALARVAYFDALVRVSRLGDAAHVAAELRASALAAGDLAAEIDANAKLGVIAWRRSQPDDALESLRRALVLAESLHDRSRQANVLLSLGILCVQIRRFDEARAFYERGRELARAEHLHRLVATFANNLGVVHHEEDRLELAQSCFDEASEQARAAGLAVLFAVSRGNVGMVHHEAGRATDARLALDAAIALLTTLGDTRYRVIFLGARAALFADQSEPEAAALDIATAASLLERAFEPQLALALSIRSAHVELSSGRSTPAHAERARAEAAAHLTEGNTSNSVAARSEVVRMALRALARRIARG